MIKDRVTALEPRWCAGPGCAVLLVGGGHHAGRCGQAELAHWCDVWLVVKVAVYPTHSATRSPVADRDAR